MEHGARLGENPVLIDCRIVDIVASVVCFNSVVAAANQQSIAGMQDSDAFRIINKLKGSKRGRRRLFIQWKEQILLITVIGRQGEKGGRGSHRLVKKATEVWPGNDSTPLL